jgi:arylformamidase
MTKANPPDLETLNREYSPSSCIDDINIYIRQYIDLSRDAKAEANTHHRLRSGLKYGETDTQCLDLYLPSGPSRCKLMVYIHGGYWQELSKEESSFAATNFQQHGFHFAVIDYTLAPKARLTDIVEENRQAIAWLYSEASQFGYDPEEIFVCGSSAGAHLSMMMLQTRWSDYVANHKENIVKGVCAVSGIYDLQPLLSTYVNDALKMDASEAEANSPLLLPLPNAVPIIIAFGANETSEFKRQSQVMAERLRAHGFAVEYKQIDARNHFDVIVDLCDKSSWLSQQTFSLMELADATHSNVV